MDTNTQSPQSPMASKMDLPLVNVSYHLVEHPVLRHKLTMLRDKSTGSMGFRNLIEEMSQLLAYEATRDLETQKTIIETPLEKTESEIVSEKIVLLSIMRAGNGMLEGMLKTLPFATAGHIGIYRDRFIGSTVEYYLRIPKEMEGKKILLLDPLLATGDTACAAIDRLKEYNVGMIRLLTILSSAQGIQKINQMHPDVEIFTLSVERGLNKDGYLLPGVGDAGDRLYDIV